ncbi:hypothetical protein [Tsukamurella hominis]|uniref:hypothetical protein n=1 Tax=Tsukamurella hominis TaxID=1970232 RepID=UPI0039E7A846
MTKATNSTDTPVSAGLARLEELLPDRVGIDPELTRIVRGLRLLERASGMAAADALEQLARTASADATAAAVALMPNRELAEAVNAEMAAHPDGSAYATLLIDEYERRDPSELLALGMQG